MQFYYNYHFALTRTTFVHVFIWIFGVRVQKIIEWSEVLFEYSVCISNSHFFSPALLLQKRMGFFFWLLYSLVLDMQCIHSVFEYMMYICLQHSAPHNHPKKCLQHICLIMPNTMCIDWDARLIALHRRRFEVETARTGASPKKECSPKPIWIKGKAGPLTLVHRSELFK